MAISCVKCGAQGTVENPVVGNAQTGLYHCRYKIECREYFDSMSETQNFNVTVAESRRQKAVMAGLMSLMAVQKAGASHLPSQLLDHDQADFRVAALGFFVEIGELVNEAQWKTWRNYEGTPVDRAKIIKEYADVLHFLAWMTNNLSVRFGITAAEFARGFMETHRENMARFRGEVPGREPPLEAGTGLSR